MITVTIRGNDDDVQKAKMTIEDLTTDIQFSHSSKYEEPPQEEKEFVLIDWKAAAEQCVCSFYFFLFLRHNIKPDMFIFIGRSHKKTMGKMPEINQKFL